MAKRLNDVAAVKAQPLRGADSAHPDVSGFCASRTSKYIIALHEDGRGDVQARPEVSVGSECLRGAVAYLGGTQRR